LLGAGGRSERRGPAAFRRTETRTVPPPPQTATAPRAEPPPNTPAWCGCERDPLTAGGQVSHSHLAAQAAADHPGAVCGAYLRLHFVIWAAPVGVVFTMPGGTKVGQELLELFIGREDARLRKIVYRFDWANALAPHLIRNRLRCGRPVIAGWAAHTCERTRSSPPRAGWYRPVTPPSGGA
jgi:hypothetical protein